MKIDKAIRAHKAWNMALQDVIYGEGDLGHHCEIGKWLHSEHDRHGARPDKGLGFRCRGGDDTGVPGISFISIEGRSI